MSRLKISGFRSYKIIGNSTVLKNQNQDCKILLSIFSLYSNCIFFRKINFFSTRFPLMVATAVWLPKNKLSPNAERFIRLFNDAFAFNGIEKSLFRLSRVTFERLAFPKKWLSIDTSVSSFDSLKLQLFGLCMARSNVITKSVSFLLDLRFPALRNSTGLIVKQEERDKISATPVIIFFFVISKMSFHWNTSLQNYTFAFLLQGIKERSNPGSVIKLKNYKRRTKLCLKTWVINSTGHLKF